MRISNKQRKLIKLIESCSGLYRNEINKSIYPDSMINALIEKGLLSEYKNRITSSTKGGK